MKAISVFLILVLFCGFSSAHSYETSYTYYDEDTTWLAGEHVVTPHYHFNDPYYTMYNDGHVTYMVYMYDYVGIVVNTENNTLQDGFIGSIEPGQSIMLTNNASYRLYASYKDVMDFGSIDIIEKTFNQWWVIIVVFLTILMAAIVILRIIYRY